MRRVPVRVLFSLLLIVLVIVATHSAGGLSVSGSTNVPWANPGSLAMHNIGPVTAAEATRGYDCTPLTYRQRHDRSKTMQSGCFIPAAFGLADPDKSTVIFNGSDEADEIRYGGQQIGLSVIPFSGSFARFGGFPGLGSYMYLYSALPNNLDDGGDMFGPAYKEMSSLPSMVVEDGSGQPLAVNPNAFAYSARGQWFVTETPAHSLIRVNLATFDILPFAPSFFIPDNPYASHGGAMAISEDGRYAAVITREFAMFTVYDLNTCKPVPGGGPLSPQNCQSYNYLSYVKDQVAGSLDRIFRVKFVRDDLLGFNVTSGGVTESYLLSPNGPITSLIPYLGLGDSYTSGQGAWNYLSGTDTATNHCHLSVYSYPLRLNGDLFSSSGHSVACSGARMHDIVNRSPRYTGQSEDQRSVAERQADGSETHILHDFTPGYLAQQDFVTAYQPGVITVQIGGNDVGFKDILMRCMSPLASIIPPVLNPNDCYASYEDRLEVEQTINRHYQRWVNLYRQLQQTAPSSKIFAIGYPQIVTNGSCGLNTPLSAGDIDFARGATQYLNSVIQKAARAAGAYYVDIADSLAGHELCSGNRGQPAMNGLTAGNDTLGIVGQETLHPTAFGHDLMAQFILRQTDNFAAARPMANPSEPPPAASSDDPLLKTADKTGRPVKTVIPVTSVSGRVYGGGTMGLTINGAETGLQPDAHYTVQVGGVPTGSLLSNSQGDLNGSVLVPPAASSGLQTVEVSGPGPNGTPITTTEIVYIEQNQTDADGDGIPNGQDSCPSVTNALQDEDGDGIDDVCDSVIATVPGVTFYLTLKATARFEHYY